MTAWIRWHALAGPEEALAADLPGPCAEQVHLSTMVLRVHQDKTYPGAMVASLSVPWGNTREEREGYHLVWPRDLCESAGALLAVGATREAHNTLAYLLATQTADGHWNQNQWLSGKGHWQGVQLDESAFPVLLAAALRERGALHRHRGRGHGAARAVVPHPPGSLERPGPVGRGLRPQYFHPPACISALVAGAPLLAPMHGNLPWPWPTTGTRNWKSGRRLQDTPLARLYGVPATTCAGAAAGTDR